MVKRTLALFAAAVLGIAAYAQASPAADGTVRPGEYSYSGAFRDMTLHASLSADGRTCTWRWKPPPPDGWP
jgi:hypothetical protein